LKMRENAKSTSACAEICLIELQWNLDGWAMWHGIPSDDMNAPLCVTHMHYLVHIA